MKREFDPDILELMDQAKLLDGEPTPELERDLANLRWLNRYFLAISILHHCRNVGIQILVRHPLFSVFSIWQPARGISLGNLCFGAGTERFQSPLMQ